MKKINNYIIEKLKLNSSTKKDEFKRGDLIVRLGVINYFKEVPDDKLMVDYFFFYDYDETGRLIFLHTPNDPKPDKYNYEHKIFINSNGNHECKGESESTFTSNTCYLDIETAQDVLPEIRTNKSYLSNVFDKNDDINWNKLRIDGNIDYIINKVNSL